MKRCGLQGARQAAYVIHDVRAVELSRGDWLIDSHAQATYVVAARAQRIHEMRADESARAGHDRDHGDKIRRGAQRAEGGGMTTSIWHGTFTVSTFPALERDVTADVCIVGAGIAGLS